MTDAGVRFPQALCDLTPEWLTRTMSRRHPAVRVAEVALVEQIDTTAMKARLRLRYAAGGEGLPTEVCVKGGLGALRDYLQSARVYEIEARFYEQIAPQLGVRAALSLGGAWDGEGRGVVILEDLTGKVTFGQAVSPLTAEQVADGLEQLALVHAKWWNQPEALAALHVGAHNNPPTPHERRMRTAECWAQTMTLPRAQLLPRFAQDRTRIGAAMDRCRRQIDHGPLTLLHGDTHAGNLFLRDGKLHFLDWQVLRAGPWAFDLNTFIISAMDMEDRRRFEQDLLKVYLGHLIRLGVQAPAFGEAWDKYRLHTADQLFWWTINMVEMQRESECICNAARFAVAAMDHDTLARLGV